MSESDAPQRPEGASDLRRSLRLAILSGRDDLLVDALARVPSPEAGRLLWEEADRAINTAPDDGRALAARAFALPVVLVVAGPPDTTIEAVLRDVDALTRVLAERGALGQAKNFALNAALCAPASLETLSPSGLHAMLRGLETGAARGWVDLPPSDIPVTSTRETAELRFITGVATTSAQAPSFLETGVDIGRWGMPFTHALADQLSQPSVTILPMARPPAGPLWALHAGRQAREEVAFHLFVTRVVRDFRFSVGDPSAEIAALEPDGIGIRLSSPLQPGRRDFHRWELDPLDDLEQVASSIVGLLRACRVERVDTLQGVHEEAEFSAAANAPPLGS